MLYLYDRALCEDLQKSFNPDSSAESIVKVVEPEQVVEVIAQMKEGQMTFPIVALTRSDDISIDTTRRNFTQMKRGVACVIDNETNQLYYEKAIPIDLSYSLTILTTNIADMDEMVRELLFKYSNMYFLTIKLPYEADRKIRFGVSIDPDATITRESGTYQYVTDGALYQSVIRLNCEGCVLVHYTPAKLERIEQPEVVPLKKHKRRK